MGAFIDLTGIQFGRFTVLKRVENNKYNKPQWLCECNCINKTQKIICGNSLRSGLTQSCGCLNKEIVSQIHLKHNLSNHKLYKVYHGMKQRCCNSKNQYYYNYGGRGINICDEWSNEDNGFINFYNWALKNGYDEKLEIDRINNDGNYEPTNCRWVTDSIQNINKRKPFKKFSRKRKKEINYDKLKQVEINGEKKSIVELPKIYNISYKTIYRRIEKGDKNNDIIRPINKRSSNISDKPLKRNITQIKNVSWSEKEQKYIVRFKIDGKQKRLGTFKKDELNNAKLFAEEIRNKISRGELRY